MKKHTSEINFRVEDELKSELFEFLGQRDISVSSFLREIIRDKLNELKQPPAPRSGFQTVRRDEASVRICVYETDKGFASIRKIHADVRRADLPELDRLFGPDEKRTLRKLLKSGADLRNVTRCDCS